MESVELLENGLKVKAFCFKKAIDWDRKTIECIAVTKRGIYPKGFIYKGKLTGDVVPWLLPASIELITLSLGLTYHEVVRLANEL